MEKSQIESLVESIQALQFVSQGIEELLGISEVTSLDGVSECLYSILETELASDLSYEKKGILADFFFSNLNDYESTSEFINSLLTQITELK